MPMNEQRFGTVGLGRPRTSHAPQRVPTAGPARAGRPFHRRTRRRVGSLAKHLLDAPGGPRESGAGDVGEARSEEHTSELQSLMRISYAVFCLQKQTRPLFSTPSTNYSLSHN